MSEVLTNANKQRRQANTRWETDRSMIDKPRQSTRTPMQNHAHTHAGAATDASSGPVTDHKQKGRSALTKARPKITIRAAIEVGITHISASDTSIHALRTQTHTNTRTRRPHAPYVPTHLRTLRHLLTYVPISPTPPCMKGKTPSQHLNGPTNTLTHHLRRQRTQSRTPEASPGRSS